MMLSTRDLSELPNPISLKRLCQSVAMLEAIFMPEWERRYYSFKANWDTGIDLFTMRDGEGDEMFIIFAESGVLIKGFAHESPISPYRTKPPQAYPGILDGIPESLLPLLQEPAFEFEATTFCIWHTEDASGWQHGKLPELAGDDPDGSKRLLVMLDGKPETYQTWASGYYEMPIVLEPVRAMYQHQPLSAQLIRALHPTCKLSDVRDEANEIQYPIALNFSLL